MVRGEGRRKNKEKEKHKEKEREKKERGETRKMFGRIEIAKKSREWKTNKTLLSAVIDGDEKK